LRPDTVRPDDASSNTEKSALINELTAAFARRLDLDDLVPFVFDGCREILGAAGISLVLYDQEHDQLYFPFVSERDADAGRKLADFRFPANRGVAGAVFHSRRSELIPDVSADPRHYSAVDEKTGTATGPMLAVPLISGEKGLGVIEAVRRRGQPPFSQSDLTNFEKLAEGIAIAVENATRFSRVKDSADRLRAEVGSLRRELARTDRFSEMIGTSPAMTDVFTLMEGAAVSSINVLIEGETGTGKELVARGIHRTSSRADGPFLALNCAALPEGLLESELFGSRRGAYTGATDDRAGLFKAANGGVLFLDEIGDMPVAMQAKLLRVLQEGEVTPLGETRSQKVNVRVLAATNCDLEAAITARTFRSDLYYRLAGFTIRLPPLRSRREDIPLMAARFLEAAAQRNRKRIDGFKLDAMEAMTNGYWRGNVRQLIHAIERAVALARDGESISVRHLPPDLFEAPADHASSPYPPATVGSSVRGGGSLAADTAGNHSPAGMVPLEQAMAAHEARHLTEALALHNGNVSRTATAMGISRVTLQKKMKIHHLR
jgi:transcriptional regulator with GAF, ATPase, and Fis domain